MSSLTARFALRAPKRDKRFAILSISGACLLYFVIGCSGDPAANPTQRGVEGTNPARSPLEPGSYPIGPLMVRSTLAPLKAEGWINGGPRSGARLLVLDIWAHWCPMCRTAAPDLVGVYEKFRARGVEFVSLSVRPRKEVEAFVRQFAVAWPSGYGASHEAVGQLGAYTAERMTSSYNPGYEVSPTLYLVGGDGRVLWSDGYSRMQKDDRRWKGSEALEAAIERELSANPAGEK